MIRLETRNILLVGVGGQGVLLASELLALGCLGVGLDVKKSEVHGMAQRGGTVSSHVRFGTRVYSPLIPKGDAHVLVAFEALEGLRSLDYLREDGLLLVNKQEIKPTTVTSGMAKYPDDPCSDLAKRHARTQIIDGLKLAQEAGDVRSINTILVGAVSRDLPVPESVWVDVIQKNLPKKIVPLNLGAFEVGRSLELSTRGG